ncbi:UvrD-helicase domain-containing protein [Moraxella sp. ZY200743]|uniref:UvrD-helicase domain-containing protein n=1 Tax=Moraxella sp. ZY200743 TaxID=2911970 RepID=UPI003D7EB9CF
MSNKVENKQSANAVASNGQDMPPAIACTLKGAYLIEASAGTGKTWTLTGIILRLFIEEKYNVQRMIATTFTRAAAAEMQERIQERLTVFYRYLLWLKSSQEMHAHWFDDALALDERADELVATALGAKIVGADDLINVHLIKHLLVDGVPAFDEAIRRVGLLLATLDKLFVGTLDSLAQKWLKEFSTEIGHQPKADILYDSSDISIAIIHDGLRQAHTQVMSQNPKLYEMIRHENIFGDIDQAYQSIQVAMNFFNVPFNDEATLIDDQYVASLQEMVLAFTKLDTSVVDKFCDKEYRDSVGVRATGKLLKHWHRLFEIVQTMAEHGTSFVRHLDKTHTDWLSAVHEALEKDNVFNKKHDENAKRLLMGFIDKHLTALVFIYESICQLPNQYRTHLYKTLALAVRAKTPTWLENQAKTTFTIQMHRLNQALANNPSLARHIRHHYPVILIDESQDVNGAQVELIQQVYLSYLIKQLNKDKPSLGFLLLVGDPKQAIYRFRGGDVANYNRMKNTGVANARYPIINQQLSLSVNRRSNKALIESLNAWFDDGKGEHGNLGEGIYYQTITAHNESQRLSWQADTQDERPSYLGRQPLAMLHLTANAQSPISQLLAWHINSLLQGGHTINTQAGERAIMPSDIAVLSYKNKWLLAVKEHLDALNIPAIAAQETNVFSTQAGRDLYALLSVCVEMSNVEKLGRLLTSSFFGMSLDEAMSMLGVDDEIEGQAKSELLIYLNQVFERWLQHGVASALNLALAKHPFMKDGSLWLSVASFGERYLADAWQILELISTQEHLQALALIEWYKMQMCGGDIPDAHKRLPLPSESGVNMMTIHKSKGLEFPIVYVIGLDEAVSENGTLFYPYTDTQFNRHLSPKPIGKDGVNYQQLDLNESIDERKRLGYVALTRASEQMYVVAKDLNKRLNTHQRPLFLWCDCADSATLSLPSRMQGKMDWLSLETDDYITKPYSSNDVNLVPIDYLAWHEIMHKTVFYGAVQTSFTALISQLDYKTKELLAVTPDHDELVALTDLETMADEEACHDDIRTTFMRGMLAGDFLHQVLQKINTKGEPQDKLYNISRAIDEVARYLGVLDYMSQDAQRAMGMPTSDNKHTLHRQLVLWMNDVIHAPFAASGVNLVSLTDSSSVKEMGFLLGIKEGFSIDELNAAFEAYSDKPLSLTKDDSYQPLYRYLKGGIDLVYEHEGRFFVVDYKSNFLGNGIQAYHEQALFESMDRAGYWLQAAIYQVALHRLLKMRVKDYVGNEHRYLGAVEYLFLRGVADDERLGRMVWQVPIELVRRLDELFR